MKNLALRVTFALLVPLVIVACDRTYPTSPTNPETTLVEGQAGQLQATHHRPGHRGGPGGEDPPETEPLIYVGGGDFTYFAQGGGAATANVSGNGNSEGFIMGNCCQHRNVIVIGADVLAQLGPSADVCFPSGGPFPVTGQTSSKQGGAWELDHYINAFDVNGNPIQYSLMADGGTVVGDVPPTGTDSTTVSFSTPAGTPNATLNTSNKGRNNPGACTSNSLELNLSAEFSVAP